VSGLLKVFVFAIMSQRVFFVEDFGNFRNHFTSPNLPDLFHWRYVQKRVVGVRNSTASIRKVDSRLTFSDVLRVDASRAIVVETNSPLLLLSIIDIVCGPFLFFCFSPKKRCARATQSWQLLSSPLVIIGSVTMSG